MSKAYVFPGQGSQFPGMGKALYERSEQARELMEKANEILGFPITDVMFGDSADDLKATRVTQPAIFIHSVVLALCSGLETPAMVAGHSLGEFSALAAAGAMSFEDALKLVAVRASAMQKCCEQVPGSMAAIIKLPTETIEEICASCSGLVIPANYNSEGQVVISGEAEAVAEACKKMMEAGAKRALPLPVSGAFHSPLMEPARLELAEAIDKTPFRAPVCPVFNDDFCPEYLEWVANIRNDEYYVKMMVAWFFATSLAKQYEATLPVIEQNRLAVWTHNKTIQKAIESFRISDEQKVYLNGLRKKC